MKKKKLKLTLSKETLAVLDEERFQAAKGGWTPSNTDCSYCEGCTAGPTMSNCPRLC